MQNKRYYSLDMFYKEKFGSKVFKVSLDAGFTCPNKDGSKNTGGCIFCNGTPYIGDVHDDIFLQFEKVKSVLHKKWPHAQYIPFLEANTNTYAPVEDLMEIYEPMIKLPKVVGLNIATRCDSITEEVYEYLKDLNKRTFLTIELGLQSCFDSTLKYLNRGHTREEFTVCVKRLKDLNICVVVHIINGLPYETRDMMIETVRYVNDLGVDGIKFHMLYIEAGTKLAEIYRSSPFHILSREEYIQVLGEQLAILDKSIVVHRLVSNPDRKKLIAPEWLNAKFTLLNDIDRYLEGNNIMQGMKKES